MRVYVIKVELLSAPSNSKTNYKIWQNTATEMIVQKKYFLLVQLRIVIGVTNHILVGDASGASLIFIPGGDLWRIDKL